MRARKRINEDRDGDVARIGDNTRVGNVRAEVDVQSEGKDKTTRSRFSATANGRLCVILQNNEIII